jgi:predicted aspartyl protease
MHYIVALLGVTASTTTSPQGPAQSRPLAEVTFTLHQNAVIVPAVVNGRDTVHLLLDTGWGPLALVFTSAQRLGLVVDAPDADGLGRAQVASLAIGDVNRSRPLVEVFPTEALAPLIGPHDGVLSTAFFRDLVLQIDYPARVVRFFRRSPIPSTPSASRTSVPMVFSPQAGALPFTDSVFVDGRPVRGLFDTGGAGAFVAMGQLVERAGLRPLPDSGRTGIGMLSGGQMVQQRVQFARVGRVAVGAFAVDSPRVMLAPPQLEGNDWGHDLIIGYGFMRSYVVTFDYPGRRVTFARPP